jgi:hypothetical protein
MKPVKHSHVSFLRGPNARLVGRILLDALSPTYFGEMNVDAMEMRNINARSIMDNI